MKRLLLTLALVGACSSDSTGPASDLQTRVTVNQDLVTPGDSLTIAVSVTNPTARTIQVEGSSACLLSFSVQAPGGPERLADPRPCPAVLETIVLRPGERREAQIVWHLTVAGDTLPLGPYLIRGGLLLAGSPGLQAPSRPRDIQIVVFGR